MVRGPAAGGGRWVEVDPQRLARWLAGFVERHGAYAVDADPTRLRIRGYDDTLAEFEPPPGVPPAADLDALQYAVVQPRRLGLLLARRAAVAVGVSDGDQLTASKVDSSYVQGRTAAGGWSQQRFARRRDNQSRTAAGNAADIAVRVLGAHLDGMAALVTGGDRRAVDAVLADHRLVMLAALRSPRFLAVGEPRLATLQEALRQALAVRIRIIDPQ